MVKVSLLFSEDEAFHFVLQINFTLKDMYNNQSVYLSIYLSICLSVWLTLYLSVCVSVYLSTNLSV
jgi:hypothetical protein